jgi:hypothetical protein
MAKTYRVLDDALGAAVQTGVPLIVRRRCTPHEVAAWTAIRFLLDTTDRSAFGSREIAAEMNTRSYPRVKGWTQALVEADVLEVVGYEEIPNLGEPRAVYRIPWKRIFEASLIEAEKCVAGTNRKRFNTVASSDDFLQLPLDFPVTDRSQESIRQESAPSVIDRSQGPVTDRSQGPIIHPNGTPSANSAPVIDRSQEEDTPESASSVIDRSQGLLPIDHRPCDRSVTWMDGRMEGRGRKRAHTSREEREAHRRPPPNSVGPPRRSFRNPSDLGATASAHQPPARSLAESLPAPSADR